MPNHLLNEREFELVNIVGAKLAANQRDLSRHLNLSLGMTNMLLRRMVTKGYIRIKQLNKKKFEYILTPKGFAEKMRKSIRYTLKTIDSIGLVKKNLVTLLWGLYNEGTRRFYILGSSDFAGLIEISVQEQGLQGCETVRISDMTQGMAGGVILICQEKVNGAAAPGVGMVNVIEKMAKDEELLGNGFVL